MRLSQHVQVLAQTLAPRELTRAGHAGSSSTRGLRTLSQAAAGGFAAPSVCGSARGASTSSEASAIAAGDNGPQVLGVACEAVDLCSLHSSRSPSRSLAPDRTRASGRNDEGESCFFAIPGGGSRGNPLGIPPSRDGRRGTPRRVMRGARERSAEGSASSSASESAAARARSRTVGSLLLRLVLLNLEGAAGRAGLTPSVTCPDSMGGGGKSKVGAVRYSSGCGRPQVRRGSGQLSIRSRPIMITALRQRVTIGLSDYKCDFHGEKMMLLTQPPASHELRPSDLFLSPSRTRQHGRREP